MNVLIHSFLKIKAIQRNRFRFGAQVRKGGVWAPNFGGQSNLVIGFDASYKQTAYGDAEGKQPW